MAFFTELEKNLKFCTDTQKALNSQLEESGSLTSDYIPKLQSSKEHCAGRKTKIQLNGTGTKLRGKSMHLWSVNLLIKKTRLCDEEKTVSSINGAGKTEQLHIKKIKLEHPLTPYKKRNSK